MLRAAAPPQARGRRRPEAPRRRGLVAPLGARLALTLGLAAALGSLAATSAQPGLALAQADLPPDALVARPAPIVWIEGGWFSMGETESDVGYAQFLCRELAPGISARPCLLEVLSGHRPVRRVYVRGFGIDRTEVTRAAYRRCVGRGRCAPPALPDGDPRYGADEQPVTGVSWADAQRYCGARGGRLPTEAEWERAARGDSHRRFPWGRLYDPALANHGRAVGGQRTHLPTASNPNAWVLGPARGPDPRDGFTHIAPVGSYPGGRSPHGLLDMAGNVSEWTWDSFGAEPDTAIAPRIRLPSPWRVVRGGSWRSLPHELRVTHRAARHLDALTPEVGFRCAYDPPDRRE